MVVFLWVFMVVASFSFVDKDKQGEELQRIISLLAIIVCFILIVWLGGNS